MTPQDIYTNVQTLLKSQGFEFQYADTEPIPEVRFPLAGVWWASYVNEQKLYLAALSYWLRHFLGYGDWKSLYQDWQLPNRHDFTDETEKVIGQMFIYCKELEGLSP
jgi:hypothetical protein